MVPSNTDLTSLNPFSGAVETCNALVSVQVLMRSLRCPLPAIRTFRAANMQPRQRLALLLVTRSPFERVLESNTYRALPLTAGYASAFKSRQSDHYSS
jgi:hypothetical protein